MPPDHRHLNIDINQIPVVKSCHMTPFLRKFSEDFQRVAGIAARGLVLSAAFILAGEPADAPAQYVSAPAKSLFGYHLKKVDTLATDGKYGRNFSEQWVNNRRITKEDDAETQKCLSPEGGKPLWCAYTSELMKWLEEHKNLTRDEKIKLVQEAVNGALEYQEDTKILELPWSQRYREDNK
ncbi:MAG TPA: hypothetical protein VIG74_05930, partial [Alphaproteobacteria bacterium]